MPNFRPLSETKFINDANLVSYWKLDGNSNDSKGSNNGTDINVSYAAGNFNQAAGFNGTSSGVSIAAFPSLSAPYTVSCWYKPNGDNTTSSIKGIVSARIDASHEWIYSIQVSNTSVSLVIGNGSNWYNTTEVPYTFTTGTWYYITTVCGVNNSKLYINGIEIQNLNYTGTPLFTKGIQAIGIGYVPHYVDSYVNASIDDVAIFNRALSASEVNELYQGMTYGEYLGAGSTTTKLLLHLNGNSTDSSGNGNNGTDTAITYVDGKFGKCASFNGTSSYIDVNVALPSAAYTISFWVKPTSSGNYALITKDYYGNGNSQRCLSPNINSNGTLDWYIWTTTRTAYDNPYSVLGVPITFSVYQLITATFDSTANKLIIYINGEKKGETATTGTQLNIANNLQIGRRSFTGSWFYTNGQIDEVIIENRAWNPQEIAKIYAYQKGYYATL